MEQQDNPVKSVETESAQEAGRQPANGSSANTKATRIASSAMPAHLLVDWARTQDDWVQKLVARILHTGSPISGEDAQQLALTLLIEHGVVEGPSADTPTLKVGQLSDPDRGELILGAIKDIKRVNALAKDASIPFHKRLTVIYGENGTGKTGFSRVMKRAAGAPLAETILHDVRSAQTANPPSAVFEYEHGGIADKKTWNNEEGLAPLDLMRVFDNKSVDLHVDGELNYEFTPASLALFSYTSDGLSAVHERLKVEMQSFHPPLKPLTEGFRTGSAVHSAVQQLDSNQDFAPLEALAKVTEQEAQSLVALQTELANITDAALAQQIRVNSEDTDYWRSIDSLIDVAKGFSPSDYNRALKTLGESIGERNTFRTELFKEFDLPGERDDEWQAFIEAGEEYKRHVGLDHDPEEGEKCIYCMQKLPESARKLIAKYASFLNDELAKRIETEEAELAKTKLVVDPAALSSTGDKLTVRLEAEPESELLVRAHSFLDALGSNHVSVDESKEADDLNVAELANELEPLVSSQVAALTGAKQALETTKTDQGKARDTLQLQIDELQDHIELGKPKRLDDIKRAIGNRERFRVANEVSNGLSNSVKVSLTSAAKKATEAVLNTSFKKRFEDECKVLRTPEVGLKFPGGAGSTKRKKTVAGSYEPSAILSEGELKSLALADFIAECAMRDAKAPLVFDDPVSSLDYKRIAEVAKRLVELSADHQVIVFTHNVWFVAELLDKVDKTKCQYLEVDTDGKFNGIVVADANPRYDTPKNIAAKINKLLSASRPSDPVVAEALARDGYGLIRSWIEAFVEQELLQNVSQRFRDNIMLGNLGKIKGDQIANAHSVVDPIYDKASGFIKGHAQASEQSNVKPSLDDLKSDFEKLTELRKQFT